MENTKKSMLLGAALAGVLAASTLAVSSIAAADDHATNGKCMGGNDCKGKGACAQEGKHDCAGKNGCGGQGYTDTTKDACDKMAKEHKDKKITFVANAAPAPAAPKKKK